MFLASRFVAGRRAEDAIEAARRVNAQGPMAILDYLGEDVTTEQGAHAAADEYLRLLALIGDSQVRAAVSLKVSQMGLLLSRDICRKNLERIAAEASRRGIFVWFDMEGSKLTRQTIEVFDELRGTFPKVGLCLQAALVRTGSDFDLLSKKPFHVRLCKGAYKEPAAIAYPQKPAVNGNYRMLAQKAFDLSPRGVVPAFATHDRELLTYILDLAAQKTVSREAFEFQMLYGIENKRLVELVQQGYQGSVYIPYGTHWFPYLLRRLRERKENVYFLLRNAFRR